MSLPDGVTPKYGIFTTDKDFADAQIDGYLKRPKSKLVKRIKSANSSYALLEDGTKYEWIKPNDCAHGYKCFVGVIDLETCSLDFIREWIPFICIFADKKDYIFLDSKKKNNNESYDLHTLIDRLQKIESILGNVKKLDFYDAEYGYTPLRQIEIDISNNNEEITFYD